MLKRITAFILSLVVLGTICFAAPSSWASGEVKTAKNQGLVPESLLSDYQTPITREEFCSMAILLYKKLSGRETPVAENVFSDTQSADVSAAYSLGIVKGVSDTAFAPDALITREEIATMLRRCIEAAKPSANISSALVNTFPDEAQISSWALDAVKLVNMCQVILGDENANINPKANTTREQAMLMVLRLYNCFRATDTSVLESYGFATSGNYTSNMPGGSFAIKALSGELYLADDSGIYSSNTKVHITNHKSSGMYVANENIYFIDKTEGALYGVNLDSKTETLLFEGAVSFFPAGEYIYIKNNENALVALSFKTKAVTPIAENITSMPLPSANTVYYAVADGIRSYNILSGEYADIFSGTAKDLTLKDNTLYLKNEDDYLCSLSIDGKDLKVITKTPVKNYCLYSSAVAYNTEDGIYKCDFAGKFNIKMIDDTNYSLCSYEKTLYLKSPEGKIFEFNPFTAEKTPLN